MDEITRRLSMGAAGAEEKIYIEDVFSTWLYEGNGSTQTITNGIDLSGKGGLVWIKYRSGPTFVIQHALYDTTRGANKTLQSNGAEAELTTTNTLTAFNSSGFTLGDDSNYATVNYNSSHRYSSWTFRKAAKFFDVVTYTGNGSTQTINHNLGSAPGLIIVKRTDATSNWIVYHRSLSSIHEYLLFNFALAVGGSAGSSPYPWGAAAPTSSQFTVGDNGSISSDFKTNQSGGTYVAYLFAHDTSTDGLIQCGSYTGNGSTTGPTITLGWEPQWVLIKRASGGTADWHVFDNMRGIATGGGNDYYINPNKTDLENAADLIDLTSTGFVPKSNFTNTNWSGSTYIYIAIRRGPMKTPTDATKVYKSIATASNSTNLQESGFPVDLVIAKDRLSTLPPSFGTRMLNGSYLLSSSTGAESAWNYIFFDSNTGYRLSASGTFFNTDATNAMFSRAPGFFDVVAYTGTGSARTVSHNLGVAPELMVVKVRNSVNDWTVYSAAIGAGKALILNGTNAQFNSATSWNSTAPTSSVFSLGVGSSTNDSAFTYIAYLFASCPGVSKIGSYTGTGTTLQINCGFTAGARFVLIKRTDSTGDWYVWDTARGIVSGNDPYLLLNSTAAEVTNTDYIDPLNSGFEISSTAPAAINANGGTYIFLAIA